MYACKCIHTDYTYRYILYSVQYVLHTDARFNDNVQGTNVSSKEKKEAVCPRAAPPRVWSRRAEARGAGGGARAGGVGAR